ncbi:MAG: autoinducer binding domain-containing protein [Rhodobacter sp.]|nr:autoinducer binding domain-containing protein [Rhodobacter sp.]
MTIDDHTNKLSELSPSGYFLALRMGFVFPVYEKKTLPKKWIDRYTSQGLVLSDPVMHWMYQNVGATRWSAISIDDPRGVLEQAKFFGLNFGVAICHADMGEGQQRSFGSFARSDREFSDAEIAELTRTLGDMHRMMVPPKNLTKAELEALRMVKNGLLMKEIANLLGVSEGAVKQRLKNAKTKLKAKTSTHAATMATTFGLI